MQGSCSIEVVRLGLVLHFFELAASGVYRLVA